MLRAIQYAREKQVPSRNLSGMQTACIEYARNVCGLADANSSEFDPATPHRVIYKLRELRAWKELGGTMRWRMAVQDRGGNAGVPSLWPDRISERIATATSSTASTKRRW